MLTKRQFAGMTDIVELSPTTTIDAVDRLIDDACSNGFHSLGCPYCYHPHVIEELKKRSQWGKIALLGGGGFADGNWPTEVKLASIARCMYLGCTEIDLTSNLGWIKSGMWDEYLEELELVRNETRGVPLKVIVHAPQLNSEELYRASCLAAQIGADYIKTDTGRSPDPTTVEHVRAIRNAVGESVRIKASGGVRTLEAVEQMIAAGTDRFGMSRSSALRILDELPA